MLKSGPKIKETPKRAIISGRDGDGPSVFRRQDVETRTPIQDKARRDIFQDKAPSSRSSSRILSNKGGVIIVQRCIIRK